MRELTSRGHSNSSNKEEGTETLAPGVTFHCVLQSDLLANNFISPVNLIRLPVISKDIVKIHPTYISSTAINKTLKS